MTDLPKCSNCVFGIAVDEGYSNYTVEGTTLYCGLGLHPNAPFDRWYGEDGRDTFAQKCARYQMGDGVTIDVDHEDANHSAEGAAKWAGYATEFVTAEHIAAVMAD